MIALALQDPARFQSLAGNSDVATACPERTGINVPSFISLQGNFDVATREILDTARCVSKNFNPLQGILMWPLRTRKRSSAHFPLIPCRNSCVARGLFRGRTNGLCSFNPLQGILMWHFCLCSLRDPFGRGFQSLAGNSDVATLNRCPVFFCRLCTFNPLQGILMWPRYAHELAELVRENFQSLAGNSDVATCWGSLVFSISIIFQSLAGNSDVATRPLSTSSRNPSSFQSLAGNSDVATLICCINLSILLKSFNPLQGILMWPPR